MFFCFFLCSSSFCFFSGRNYSSRGTLPTRKETVQKVAPIAGGPSHPRSPKGLVSGSEGQVSGDRQPGERTY